MERAKLTVPSNVAYCRGRACDNLNVCGEQGMCSYRSSSEEYRAAMRTIGEPVVTETEIPLLEENKKQLAAFDAGVVAPVPDMKATNPKDAIGSDKMPFHLWPETATALGTLGLLDGALKYGRANFREIGVRATIYVDAARRHLGAYFEGEDNDPDSGLPHLAHALACLAILVDAQAAGKLNDDRNIRGGYRPFLNSLTPHVARLKKLHAGKSPKHYTIQDNK